VVLISPGNLGFSPKRLKNVAEAEAFHFICPRRKPACRLPAEGGQAWRRGYKTTYFA